MVRASKNHLAQVDESYFEHLSTALGFSIALAKASLACGLHALIPALCTSTASRSVAELQAKLVRRAAHTRSHRDRVGINS
jgi:uncharacterized protein DUF6356